MLVYALRLMVCCVFGIFEKYGNYLRIWRESAGWMTGLAVTTLRIKDKTFVLC
jgi:hypothetical protein